MPQGEHHAPLTCLWSKLHHAAAFSDHSAISDELQSVKSFAGGHGSYREGVYSIVNTFARPCDCRAYFKENFPSHGAVAKAVIKELEESVFQFNEVSLER